MLNWHVGRELAGYLDGRLAPQTAERVERHLRSCGRCRAERDQIASGIAAMQQLPAAEAPDHIWPALEAALRENRAPQAYVVPRWRWAFAVILLAGAAGAYWRVSRPAGARWDVARLEGAPRVGAKPLRGNGRVGAGEWIETDAASRAALQVGAIGSVEVEPNTRVRVVTAQPGEHRLALARGEIRATISAPPKLFFVDTAAGTAVDLGCEYALHADENGSGSLRVTRGWVSFQWKGIESLVPAGATCALHPEGGPGIPHFDDAAENLKETLDNFGFVKTGDEVLDEILSESRVRDTLSLWHLLSRVGPDSRGRIFDRMTALTTLPAGISRPKALALDPDTLKRLREELAWKW